MPQPIDYRQPIFFTFRELDDPLNVTIVAEAGEDWDDQARYHMVRYLDEPVGGWLARRGQDGQVRVLDVEPIDDPRHFRTSVAETVSPAAVQVLGVVKESQRYHRVRGR